MKYFVLLYFLAVSGIVELGERLQIPPVHHRLQPDDHAQPCPLSPPPGRQTIQQRHLPGTQTEYSRTGQA